jgi:hypothetical protein
MASSHVCAPRALSPRRLTAPAVSLGVAPAAQPATLRQQQRAACRSRQRMLRARGRRRAPHWSQRRRQQLLAASALVVASQRTRWQRRCRPPPPPRLPRTQPCLPQMVRLARVLRAARLGWCSARHWPRAVCRSRSGSSSSSSRRTRAWRLLDARGALRAWLGVGRAALAAAAWHSSGARLWLSGLRRHLHTANLGHAARACPPRSAVPAKELQMTEQLTGLSIEAIRDGVLQIKHRCVLPRGHGGAPRCRPLARNRARG